MIKLILGFIVASCFFGGLCYAQIPSSNTQNNEFADLINSLDRTNQLRIALERGYRGDGIHHSWMDEMKSLRIKQAAYIFHFKWRAGEFTKIEQKEIYYLKQYYQYDRLIKDRPELDRIELSGLAKTLRIQAVEKAKNFLGDILKDKQKASGTVYINLLDDERLPPVVTMPIIN